MKAKHVKVKHVHDQCNTVISEAKFKDAFRCPSCKRHFMRVMLDEVTKPVEMAQYEGMAVPFSTLMLLCKSARKNRFGCDV